MRRIFAITLLGLAAPVTFAACGGDSTKNEGGNDGSSGTSGSPAGGTAGTGTSGKGGSGTSGASGASGTAGKGGSNSGSGGTAPSGGDAGTAPNGGVGGSAGGGSGGGGGRECETADDCVLRSDCCSCEAVPKSAEAPSCDLACGEEQCFARQIGPEEVTCSFGRCVIDRSCDHSRVTCDSLPEPCPEGQMRSLSESGCYGPCLAPTECRDVTDCASCGDAVCVIEEPQIRSFGCVRPPDSCAKGSYCECLDACPASGFVCDEQDDAVHCPCPVC